MHANTVRYCKGIVVASGEPVVYKIVCPEGKGYVGKTVNFAKRMKFHATRKTKCPEINNATLKHGWDNMRIEILERPTSESLNDREIALIKEHQTLKPNGYNVLLGGDGGNHWGFDDERDQRIREKLRSIKQKKFDNWTSEMSTEEKEEKRHKRVRSQKLRQNKIARQKAGTDSVRSAYATRADKRNERANKLPPAQRLLYLRSLRNKAENAIAKRKAQGKYTEETYALAMQDFHRNYQEVPPLEEIRAMLGRHGGVPGPRGGASAVRCERGQEQSNGVPGPPASSEGGEAGPSGGVEDAEA